MVRTGRGEAQLAQMPAHLLDQCHVTNDLNTAIAWIMETSQE
jgi:hypothetical protein